MYACENNTKFCIFKYTVKKKKRNSRHTTLGRCCMDVETFTAVLSEYNTNDWFFSPSTSLDEKINISYCLDVI